MRYWLAAEADGAEDLLSAERLAQYATAFVLVLAAALLWKFARPDLERRLAAARTPSFGAIFSKLVFVVVWFFALGSALALVFPSFNLATFLGGLGLLGVAAGFAFQDILSNLLAGILLTFRQPFTQGDQIEVDGIAGTVDLITIRETRIRTYGGRMVYVPNATVYKSAIEVQTDRDMVRTSMVVGVGYETDLDLARRTALEVLRGLDGVIDDPEPQALFIEWGASSINLDLRYWTSSRQADVRAMMDEVVRAVTKAFDAEQVNIPFDIVTLEAGETFGEVMDGRSASAG